MKLINKIAPNPFSKKSPKRLGRGVGSGLGKTSGKGHKGQHARAGGYHKLGFEGGQMPLQRRLPKFGFTSRKNLNTDKVRLSDLNKITETEIDLSVLKTHKMVDQRTKQARIYLEGTINRAVTITGLYVTKGAKAEVSKMNGTVK